MKHFPIFLAVDRRRIVVSGGGDAALAKVRLLLKTTARISVYANSTSNELRNLASRDSIKIVANKL